MQKMQSLSNERTQQQKLLFKYFPHVFRATFYHQKNSFVYTHNLNSIYSFQCFKQRSQLTLKFFYGFVFLFNLAFQLNFNQNFHHFLSLCVQFKIAWFFTMTTIITTKTTTTTKTSIMMLLNYQKHIILQVPFQFRAQQSESPYFTQKFFIKFSRFLYLKLYFLSLLYFDCTLTL